MESDALKSLELDKIGGLLTSGVASELHRLELERASWMAAMAQSHSLAEQMKKLVGDTSLAAQMRKQAKEPRRSNDCPEGPLEPCCTAAQRQCTQVSVQFALVCARHSDGGQRAQPRKARENELASLYCSAVAMSATGRLVLRRSCRASAYRRRFKSV